MSERQRTSLTRPTGSTLLRPFYWSCRVFLAPLVNRAFSACRYATVAGILREKIDRGEALSEKEAGQIQSYLEAKK